MKKTVGKALIIYFLLVILFTSLLLTVSIIPRSMIKNNIYESIKILKEEDETFIKFSYGKVIRIDNSSDAIMLNIAYSVDDNNHFKSILLNERNFVPDSNQKHVDEEVGNLKYETEDFSMVEELENTFNEKDISARAYSKYWHGYLVLLRPMLVFLNIKQIRKIFFIILVILLIILLYELKKKVAKRKVIFFFMGIMTIDLLLFSYVVQGVFTIMIALFISIIIAKNKDISREKYLLLMFISGGLTAYLDFLTTPLLVGLLPIVVKNLIDSDSNNGKNIMTIIKEFIADILVFTIGYVSLWVTKWILIDSFFHTRVIQKGIAQVKLRTTHDSGHIYPVVLNIKNSVNLYTIVLLGLFEGLFIYRIIKTHKIGEKKDIVYYLCILTIVVYYMIVNQHSIQHYFFTYKNIDIIYLCLMLLCC